MRASRQRSHDRPPGERSLRDRGTRGGVGENDRPHLLAVDSPVRVQDAGAEPDGDGLRGLGAGRRHPVRKLVGIETRHTMAAEPIEDMALAGGDAAGERDSQHCVSLN